MLPASQPESQKEEEGWAHGLSRWCVPVTKALPETFSLPGSATLRPCLCPHVQRPSHSALFFFSELSGPVCLMLGIELD